MKSRSSVITGVLIAIAAFFAIPAAAQIQQPQPSQNQAPQIELSDDELKIFMDAAMNAQAVQAESQQEMIAIVEKEGIGVETYNEIMQAKQMGQSVEDLDVSEEDAAGFENAEKQIMEIEEQMGEKLVHAVQEKGMDMDRFQEINMAIQQDPELQQRAQQMIQEMQMQQQMQQQPEQQQQGQEQNRDEDQDQDQN
jgi:hypothetical protein